MTDDDLARICGNHTGMPWFNCHNYTAFRGHDALALQVGNSVDDLGDVIERLRGENDYEKSDRLRDIRDRLNDALALPYPHHCRAPGQGHSPAAPRNGDAHERTRYDKLLAIARESYEADMIAATDEGGSLAASKQRALKGGR